VGAFRITDGEQVWRFNIVPDDGEPGADTWGRILRRKHGGGNLWTPMSFDEKRNLLYVPGGNAAPDLYDDDRPGDNLYTNSLIALDAATVISLGTANSYPTMCTTTISRTLPRCSRQPSAGRRAM